MPSKPISPTSVQWRSYLTLFFCVSGALAGGVTCLNYLVDPYLTHQWDTALVQRLRPQLEKLSAWGKTYAVAKYRPAVIYLGNSRTEVGLPASVPVFKGKTVFNGALSGASLGDAIAMLQHAQFVSRLDTVVWGLDAPSFALSVGNTDFDRALVADGAGYFFRRALLSMQRGLTLNTTLDSIDILRGTFGAVCRSNLAFYGQRDDACTATRIADMGGTSNLIVPRLQEFPLGAGPTAPAFDALDAALAPLCQRGTRIRLYINPTHALMLDALYWSGKWPAMEQWQQSLAALGERRRHGACDVRLFDFSGFNSVTSEPIPQFSQRSSMMYYWETSHYRDNVGRMILERMFGGGGQSAPSDFGVELTPDMLPLHLAQMRAKRDLYHIEHPGETEFVKHLASTKLAKPQPPERL